MTGAPSRRVPVHARPPVHAVPSTIRARARRACGPDVEPQERSGRGSVHHEQRLASRAAPLLSPACTCLRTATSAVLGGARTSPMRWLGLARLESHATQPPSGVTVHRAHRRVRDRPPQRSGRSRGDRSRDGRGPFGEPAPSRRARVAPWWWSRTRKHPAERTGAGADRDAHPHGAAPDSRRPASGAGGAPTAPGHGMTLACRRRMRVPREWTTPALPTTAVAGAGCRATAAHMRTLGAVIRSGEPDTTAARHTGAALRRPELLP